ncbi:MAG: hypothetical protein ACJ74N_16940 [Gaiellaceae bacterium]
MICLSFDTDHVDEARMGEFLDAVPIPGSGTFFCTQRYTHLAALHHELGPHPTLEAGTDWDAALQEGRELFPEATGWRSHTCIFSHMLALQLAKLGYVYATTHDDFGGRSPTPVRAAWGLWQVPIYYMDNLDFSTPRFWPELGWEPFAPVLIQRAVEDDRGLYVFDFHPVHLLLNTPSAEYYLDRRERFRDGVSLERLRFDGYGARNFYDDLVAEMARHERQSFSIAEGVARFTALTDVPADVPA